MKDINNFTEEYIKFSLINTILMINDKMPIYNYTRRDLNPCSIDNLEQIRDNLIVEYNKAIEWLNS